MSRPVPTSASATSWGGGPDQPACGMVAGGLCEGQSLWTLVWVSGLSPVALTLGNFEMLLPPLHPIVFEQQLCARLCDPERLRHCRAALSPSGQVQGADPWVGWPGLRECARVPWRWLGGRLPEEAAFEPGFVPDEAKFPAGRISSGIVLAGMLQRFCAAGVDSGMTGGR